MRCNFLPPYLVDRLAVIDADPPLVASGQLTLRVDQELRSHRQGRARLAHRPRAGSGVSHVVHDAHNREQLPGDVARSASDPATGDLAVDEACDATRLTLDLFAAAFGRSSVDGDGATVSITVHYGQGYDNAFWDGQQLVFGDGDGQIFERFTKAMDVLAHEFAHGVTQFTAGLAYQGQPGALNESVSDVFAALAKQRSLGQTADQGDWLIGAGLFRPGVQARALRSMIEPGTAYDDPRLGRDPQVATMADYVDTEEDSGGVHINSGIPNRAFALAATEVGGHSWNGPGRIWYDAITSGEVGAGTDFAGFAQATLRSAGRLFPDDASVGWAVRAAWEQVGVPVASDRERLPAAEQPGPAATLVAVSRSGGFTGLTRSGELDLDSDPAGGEVRELLTGLDLEALGSSAPGADRFSYTVQYGSHRVTVPEQNLTPALHRVVQIVLGHDGEELGSS